MGREWKSFESERVGSVLISGSGSGDRFHVSKYLAEPILARAAPTARFAPNNLTSPVYFPLQDLRQRLSGSVQHDGLHETLPESPSRQYWTFSRVLASTAPYPAEGLDYFAGMGEENVAEFRATLRSREACEQFVEAAASELLGAPPETIVQAFHSLLCPAMSRPLRLESPSNERISSVFFPSR